KREAGESGICDAVEPHHRAARLAIPDEKRCGRVFTHDADIDSGGQDQRLCDPVRAGRQKQYWRAACLSEIIEAVLNGQGVVSPAVPDGSVTGLYVGPAWKRPDELLVGCSGLGCLANPQTCSDQEECCFQVSPHHSVILLA